MNIAKVKIDCQDRSTAAWKMLCEYVHIIAETNAVVFAPKDFLGPELFAQIYTLPETIATLKSVKKMKLYGSNIRRIPPEIGQMTSLDNFDPYTSYDLNWFPYEITNCKNLQDSRISTRALYGNYKNKKPFPDLTDNPVRYIGENVYCSICSKELTYHQVNQVWISLGIGSDIVPLLANLCSHECGQSLPAPPPGYIPHAHKGGPDLKLPNIKSSW